ncbi:MAG: hypothetical protein Q9220_003095 [cf. Caloplaca sp. 1 TL-2023]
MTAGKEQILKSYRNLYRQALRAIQYSSPARYTLKNLLQLAYRRNAREAYNVHKIDNTIVFLKHAAEERGFEHRLLKNLLHMWWWQGQTIKRRRDAKGLPANTVQPRKEMIRSASQHLTITLRLLNESMNMCLPEQELNAKAIEELDAWKQERFFHGTSPLGESKM